MLHNKKQENNKIESTNPAFVDSQSTNDISDTCKKRL